MITFSLRSIFTDDTASMNQLILFYTMIL